MHCVSRGGLLGGDPGHTMPGVENQAGQELGQQLQHIIRGELRRMLEVGFAEGLAHSFWNL